MGVWPWLAYAFTRARQLEEQTKKNTKERLATVWIARQRRIKRGYGLIGKTTILHIVNSGSRPDISIFFYCIFYKHLRNRQGLPSKRGCSELYGGVALLWGGHRTDNQSSFFYKNRQQALQWRAWGGKARVAQLVERNTEDV